jgi:hypothetical protein
MIGVSGCGTPQPRNTVADTPTVTMLYELVEK